MLLHKWQGQSQSWFDREETSLARSGKEEPFKLTKSPEKMFQMASIWIRRGQESTKQTHYTRLKEGRPTARSID